MNCRLNKHREKWVLESLQEKITDNSTLCSNHFTEDDYETRSVRIEKRANYYEDVTTYGKSALTHQREARTASTDTECTEISAEPSLCSSQKLSTSA